MNIIENIYSALSGIMGNKMRSLLTMFGIVVGISSVIMIVSVGEGYKESMNKDFEKMGLDRLTFSVNREGNKVIEDVDVLTYEDVKLVRKIPGVKSAGAKAGDIWVSSAFESLQGESLYAILQGYDKEYQLITNTELIAGRLFSEFDMDNNANVVVIDVDLAMAVFGNTDVIGETLEVRLWDQTLNLSVIGITESTSNSQMYLQYGYAFVTIPLSLMQEILNSDKIDVVEIKAENATDLDKVTQAVMKIIEMNHENEDQEKYTVRSVSDQMAEVDSIIGIFTLFMGIVAAISLLVGGIGVMNIMLVSVTERTREIGIRKSLGATDWNIQFQFLVEAVIITIIGGIIGILFGYLGGMGFGAVAGMLTGSSINPHISFPVVMAVVGVSSAIGIIFGVMPANKAAKLDPIEALRYE